MGRYILKRLLLIIPIIFCVVILIFSLMYVTPGDPAIMILGDTATEEQLISYRAYLGVDQPYIVQLTQYLKRLFIDFNLGDSWVSKVNITTEIAARMPRTFIISCYSILVSAVSGIVLGVAAAVRQNGIADKIVLFTSSAMHCIPGYVYALILIIVFSVNLRWLPSYGISSWKCYILPCACIFITGFSGLARQTRSSMLEVIRSDFVMAARAQGFSKRTVNYRHALPNALIPVATQLGVQFSHALSGTLILETIFAIPGMGTYIQKAISMRDVPIVTGSCIVLSVWFCLVMVLVDIIYAILDPRIRAQYAAQSERHPHRKERKKV